MTKKMIKKIIDKITKTFPFLNKETVLYLVFGVLTTVISIITYKIFYNVIENSVFANTISTLIAVLFAFVTNKIWVFESKSLEAKIIIKEIVAFFLARSFTFLIETAMLYLLVDYLKFNETIIKTITSAIIIILNYFLSKKAVFNKHTY